MEYGHNGIERINGIKMNLAKMPMRWLQNLETHCAERLEDARDDLMIVQDYIGAAIVRDQLQYEQMELPE